MADQFPDIYQNNGKVSVLSALFLIPPSASTHFFKVGWRRWLFLFFLLSQQSFFETFQNQELFVALTSIGNAVKKFMQRIFSSKFRHKLDFSYSLMVVLPHFGSPIWVASSGILIQPGAFLSEFRRKSLQSQKWIQAGSAQQSLRVLTSNIQRGRNHLERSLGYKPGAAFSEPENVQDIHVTIGNGENLHCPAAPWIF
jgi:hypothetical protein